MKKIIFTNVIFLAFLLFMGGCAVKVQLKDSKQILELCDRTTFKLIIRQLPNKIQVFDGVIIKGKVRFKNSKLTMFDFAKSVRMQLLVNTPEDSGCPMRTGGYQTEEIILKRIDDKTYEADLTSFKRIR